MSNNISSTKTKNENIQKLIKYFWVFCLGALLTLFTQAVRQIRTIKNLPPFLDYWWHTKAATFITPLTWWTLLGLVLLIIISLIGVMIGTLCQKTPVKFLRTFPLLGWVSIVSLVLCLCIHYLGTDFCKKAINAVDLQAIVTPLLALAGIAAANRLKDLTSGSWKFIIVTLFVFFGSYFCRTLIAQLGLFINSLFGW